MANFALKFILSGLSYRSIVRVNVLKQNCNVTNTLLDSVYSIEYLYFKHYHLFDTKTIQ